MERYEAYKDSGVEWIGEIPEKWDVVTLKMVCNGIQDGTHGTFERVSEGVPLLSSKNVTEKGLYISEAESAVSELDANSIVANGYPAKNDLLFCCVGTIGKSCLYEFDEPLPFQRSVAFIRPGRFLNPSFLQYLAWSCVLQGQAESLQNKSIQGGLYLGLIGSLKIPLASRLEQQAIADYLDAKTAEIDGLVADCEREVELLQEYRRAVISEAVTKGLDPNVPMKDSGVEWIGRIPEGWSILYPKKLFALRKERAYPNDVQLTASQKNGIVTQNEYMRLENQRVVQVITGNDILKHVEAGDFVISMRSFQGGLEYSTICGKISSAYVMLYAIDRSFICDEYYKYLFKSDEYIQALQSTSNLVRDGQALRFSNFVQVYLPVPSVAEQQRIAQYLDIKTAEIDSLIEMKQQMADKLREYRKSLISEAVTGKFKVSGID